MEQVLQEDTVIEVGASDFEALKSSLEAFEPPLHLVPEDGGFRVTGEVDAESLNRHCFDKGVALSKLRTKKRDLESRFLEITDE